MSFLTPMTALFAAAIAVPALVVLYFLKLRRRRMQVSSTLLWKQAVQDLQVNSPFQKMKRNLMLLIQLIILAALLFAVARPVMQANATTGKRVVILIDQSASMNALVGNQTRLDAAKQAAIQIIDNLDIKTQAGQLSGAMVVAFAERPQVLTKFTTNKSQLRNAIDSISATDQGSYLDLALSVIEPEVVHATSSDVDAAQLYVISDGHVEAKEKTTLSISGANLNYIAIGKDQSSAQPDNIAITALAARRDPDKPQYVQIFAKLSNYSLKNIQTSVTLRMNGQVVNVRPVSMQAMTTNRIDEKSVQFDLRYPGHAMLEVSLGVNDALAADNRASLMLAPAKQLRVLLVSEGNAYWNLALRSIGVRELVEMSPRKYENQNIDSLRRGGWDTSSSIGATGEGFDVIVFDHYSPKQLPPINSIFMGAVPTIDDLDYKESHDESSNVTGFVSWDQQHETMQSVALDDVLFKNQGWLSVPDNASILATSEFGPVIAEVKHQDYRYIVSAFGILDSRWPLHLSFPVFVDNTIQYLGLGDMANQAGISYRAGDIAVIAADDDKPIQYTGPVELASVTPQSGRAILQRFERVGIYHTDSDLVSEPYKQIAVNMLNPYESNLQIVDVLQVGTSVVQGESQSTGITREVWHLFIWGALIFLIVEWLLYLRRMHL